MAAYAGFTRNPSMFFQNAVLDPEWKKYLEPWRHDDPHVPQS